jgi:transposase InsO family protein
MPWRETCPMDQRRKFIEDWLGDEWNLADLCKGYGISRKTGYKWLERFKNGGFSDLADRFRAHRSHPSTTARLIEAQIVQLRHRYPFWGPRKLKRRLERLCPNQNWPAASTIGSILGRHGLVMQRRRRYRTPIYAGPLVDSLKANDVWAADFKGWFRTVDGTRVDPLTVSDCASRYLIRCRVVAQTNGDNVRAQMTAAFQEFGMPTALRTDNGAPFATVGLGGLSELAVWLIRLGITPERIRPAHPEENGAHERMHRTLKQQTAKPPKANLRAQQNAFDDFRAEYNEDRPHEALGMRTPADVYTPSRRAFPRKLPPIEYPAGSTTRLVTTNGCINFQDKRIYLSNALMNEYVRIDENGEHYEVWFGPVQLGKLDLTTATVSRTSTKVLPMIPV